MAFVKFVEDNGANSAKFLIAEKSACENAFREKTEPRSRAGRFFKANLIADRIADLFVHFLGDTAGGHTGCDSTGFEHENLSAELQEGWRNTRGLACARGGLNHKIGFIPQAGRYFRQQFIDGQSGRL
jgi:hypothetical protein